MYLVDRESDAEVLDSHLLLLTSVLLHESDETGALSVSVIILEKIDDVLGVVGERGEVTTPSSSLLQPAARLDHGVPALHCRCKCIKKLDISGNPQDYSLPYMQVRMLSTMVHIM